MSENIDKAIAIAVQAIQEIGFHARAVRYGKNTSIQIVVEEGDERIRWYDSTMQASPFVRGISADSVQLRTPSGFFFNFLLGQVYLSHPIKEAADALLLAQIMCGPRPIAGPLALSRRDLEAAKAAVMQSA